MKKLFILFILLIPIFVYAQDITKTSTISINGTTYSKLTDGNENSYSVINNPIKITNEEDIYGIYIIYEMKSVTGNISNNIKKSKIGENNFLHEYIDVDKLIGHSKEIELVYDEEVKIGEIYILSAGDLPEYVEVWNLPCKKADLVLFSTHSDDEQLFFAGLMPTYVDRGACIQVVYFTNHNNTPRRLHEQVHGLYKVGIRNYPVIGFIPDAWSESLNGALNNIKNAGYSEEDAIKFEVEMIRKFKPQVVVGHDEKGEYSHGQHILNTYVLEKALELTNDETYDNESKEKYGLWDVPKTYLHLYDKNQITMDYDTPLNSFNGLTAYEVSKLGYKEHHSQQYTWFTKWLTGVNDKGAGTPFTKATEIKTYSPCQFGLYRSLVGDDVEKNDMFENLTLRKDEVKEEEKDTTPEKVKDIVDDITEFDIQDHKEYIFYGLSALFIIYVFIKLTKKRK